MRAQIDLLDEIIVDNFARCGNAVPSRTAAALVRANLPEWCELDISTMQEFREAVAV